MLKRFLRRNSGSICWGFGFSIAMACFIVFTLVPRPFDPWWSHLLRALMIFSGLFLTKLATEAILDPEVGAKLKERLKKKTKLEEKLENWERNLERSQEQRKARLDQERAEAMKNMRAAWRDLFRRETKKP